MKGKNSFIRIWIAGLVLVLATVSCQTGNQASKATAAPTRQSEPQAAITQEAEEPPATNEALEPTTPPTSPPATEAPAQTEAPPAQPQPTEAPAPAPASCTEPVCIEEGTFLLKRPAGEGGRNVSDPSNRFGEFQRSTRNSNLGVSFLNSTGTPVVAAAAGKVVVAGDDSKISYGGRPNTYGNLVILEHNLPGASEPVYTLYAHLSEVLVGKDDAVEAGEEIGKVGMSGNVAGSTLYFEVRVGKNIPEAARNPELWLEPLSDETGQPLGAIAGRLVDAQGKFIDIRNIVLEQLGGPGQPAVDQFYIRTYTDKDLIGLSPWEENFALSGLPAGQYQISVWLNGMYTILVDVEPGMLSRVNFVIK